VKEGFVPHIQPKLRPRAIFGAFLAFTMLIPPAGLSKPKPQERPAPKKLQIVIVEGEGAINNVRERTAREPIVQVTDENDRPVAGATVFFLLPDSGPTATFPDGTNSLRVVTDNQGRAVARGLRANAQSGKYQVRVEASFGDLTASSTINQANAVLSAGAAGGGISGKALAVIAIVGGAAAAGIAVAASSGGNGGGTTPQPPPPGPTPTTITPGAPSVGAP
jgi:hypothetical protein